MKYISQEAAIEVAMRYCPDDDGVCSEAGIDLREMLDELEAIPTADVRPVVHGEWDEYEDFDEYGGGKYVEWACSECCYIVKRGWAIRDKNIDKKPPEHYCPNCGADMKEELE